MNSMNSVRTMRANQIYMNMHKGALADMKAARAVLKDAMLIVEAVKGAQFKTLKSKKAKVQEALDSEAISKSWAVCHALQHMGLVSTGANALRNAMQGFSCCALATTFQEFEEQCEYVMARGTVAMNAINAMIMRCTAHAEFFRSGVKREAKARLPAVAVPKKEKRHAIAQHIAAWTDARTGEYNYWQPLQTSQYPFRSWCLAVRFNYQIWGVCPSKW